MRFLVFFVVLILSFTFGSTALAGGKLLIVGGALESSNAQVYRAFIDAIPAQAKIAIVPAASGRPALYAEKFRKDLNRYGVTNERIVIVPLALVDDPSTDVDESKWQDNAYSTDLLASLEGVQGFWFVGGDQTRITQLLMRDGEESPLLKFIRDKLQSGAIVGGTSAGAAMMSHQMIAGGDSVSALLSPPAEAYTGMESQELGQLYWQPGLNFLPSILVDQHFDRKARLGRLAVAMCRLKQGYGLGVDEDTAAFVDLEKQSLRVLGRGNVVWLEAATGGCNLSEDSREQADVATEVIRQFSLSLMAAGDSWQWSRKLFKASDGKQKTVGREAFAGGVHSGGGFALANARLDQSLGFDLLDNSDSTQLDRFTLARFQNHDYLVRYQFKQSPKSEGYWGYLDGTKDSYSAVNVIFSVELRRLSERLIP
ncbi:cyanophycinase [Simiduia curdlanivorans]|uniref:Cyanophycinase n=1 Tax=Simiduia curdlanivorans TaxID=1492769 RepID=A0ABV8V5J7_9GAMM|nr:cyanophycinase [Simiduia curdlanivorans]MDN3638234.1 cyanophycinase [Simiduia curdlanivorans]